MAQLERDTRRLSEENAVIKERIGAAIRRMNDCLDEQKGLETYLRDREKARAQELVEQAKERKKDRHWLIGIALSSAALVIAALGLLVDKV